MDTKKYSSGLPAALLDILECIENDDLIDCKRLINILSLADLKSGDFLNYSKFNHDIKESYGRNKIFSGNNFSVYVMSWSQGDFTAIHSHGNTNWGAVYFFGDVDHRLYNVNGNTLGLSEKSIIPYGSIVPVTGNLVHAMGNLRKKPVMSLHIYGSDMNTDNANNNSTVYELEKKWIRITDGTAFINISDHLCKATYEGPDANTETVLDYFRIIRPFYLKNGNTQLAAYIDKVLNDPAAYSDRKEPKDLVTT